MFNVDNEKIYDFVLRHLIEGVRAYGTSKNNWWASIFFPDTNVKPDWTIPVNQLVRPVKMWKIIKKRKENKDFLTVIVYKIGTIEPNLKILEMSGNNPRKFKDRIALLAQKQAEGTAQFQVQILHTYIQSFTSQSLF